MAHGSENMSGPFVPPPPTALYTAAELFAGFDPDDPQSWRRTLDGRAFVDYVRSGRRNPDLQVAQRQAAHDAAVSDDLTAALQGRRPVAIMGGHQLVRGDAGYRAVAEIARSLTRAGCTVLSGGGPGAMEAAHLGARLAYAADAGMPEAIDELAAPGTRSFPLTRETDLISPAGQLHEDAVAALHAWQRPAFRLAEQTRGTAAVSIGIPTWLYGHEPPTPFATAHAKYFANSVREDGLLAVALYGVIYAPGSAGTLQEIYADAAQNYYRSVDGVFSPMVFLDTDEIWTRTYGVEAALRQLFAPVDFTGMVEFVTGPQAAVAAILSRRPQIDALLAAPG